jgi:hypothetical protein
VAHPHAQEQGRLAHGHGNLAPVEMLTGYNLPDLAERSLDLMDEMLSGFSGAKKAAAEIETVYSNENGVITLSNSLIELQWKGSNGVLTGLKNKQTGTQHLGGDLFSNWTAFVDLTTSNQWSAWLGTLYYGRNQALTSATVSPLSNGAIVDLVWNNIGPAGQKKNIIVKQHITVYDGDPVSRWTTEVINNEPNSTVTAFVSPQLTGIQTLPNERLMWPYKEGEIHSNPGTARRILRYPTSLSMQWMNLFNDQESLYYAVLDDTARHKEFRFGYDQWLDPQTALKPRQMSVTHWPYTMDSTTFTSPVVEIGVASEGVWYWGADRYRDWLINTAGWAKTHSPKARCLDSWLTGFNKFYREPLRMTYAEIPAHLEDRANYGIKNLHMLGWHYDGFDSYYPDYKYLESAGGEAGLASAIQQIHNNNKNIFLYLNNHIADLGSDWYIANAGLVEAQDVNGNFFPERYNTSGRDFYVMSPHSSLWINQLKARAMSLREKGADGIWWDQQGEMPSILDYNKDAGHSSPSYAWAEGYTKMMNEIHDAFSYNGTDNNYVFAMEGVNDFHSQFIDVMGMNWARKLGWSSFHAPQVTRYTIPSKFIGLTQAGVPINDKNAYAIAFTMGNLLWTPAKETGKEAPNPYVFPRYLNIYNSEPTIYFTGAYKDERGLEIQGGIVKGTTIVGEHSDRLGLQLRNPDSEPQFNVVITLEFDKIGLAGKEVTTVSDMETGEAVLYRVKDNKLTITVDVPALDVKAYKVTF